MRKSRTHIEKSTAKTISKKIKPPKEKNYVALQAEAGKEAAAPIGESAEISRGGPDRA